MEQFSKEALARGYDFFVADYLRGESLSASGVSIRNFIAENEIEKCSNLHIFAFIAGAWSLNPVLRESVPHNLRTIVYDRSPLQEQAPRVASQELPVLVRKMFGNVIFELARTPYPALDPPPGIRVGLIVETRATSLIRFFKEEALKSGPVSFDFAGLQQTHDDAVYLPFDHDRMYSEFEVPGGLVLDFARDGRFPASASRKFSGSGFETD